MKVKISAGCPKGSVSAPPSKSYAHRMILCAALANGESVIKGVSKSEDVLATLDCARAIGARCTLDEDTLTVVGIGKEMKQGEKPISLLENIIYPCRESGSTMRFFIPVSLVIGSKAEFAGSKRLMERGIGIYEKLFKGKGIACQNNGTGISVSGGLTAGEYVLQGNVSSQFVSGLMFALPLLCGDSVIKVLPPVESRGYIDITLDVLSRFGVHITETEKNTFYVRGGQGYEHRDLTVEGDWSNGAALLALGETAGAFRLNREGSGINACGSNSIHRGVKLSDLNSENPYVKVSGLNKDSLQGDKVCVQLFEKLRRGGEEINISDCPDLGPVLFAVAAIMGGGKFVGTGRLKIKESNRASAMAEELEKFGISVTVGENSVEVHWGTLKTPTVSCQSHNDHRIVMALSLLGALVGCEIEGAEAITKSYPEFFSVLTSLGVKVETENEA